LGVADPACYKQRSQRETHGDMMSSPDSRLRPEDETPLKAEGVRAAHPMEPESKQAPDASAQERTESLVAAEQRTLEMIANGAGLSEVLDDLCAAIDAHAPAAASMVCLMDLDGKQLLPAASPHVPAAFTRAITPWPIGPNRGSCGTAAFTKQRVIIPDISNDPRWPDEARDLALAHGFCAAWSEPLISKDGEVLGTFCLSYAEPRTPNSRDLELIEAAGNIARIAIERERSRLALTNALVEIKNSENKLRTIIDTIPALAWSARPDGSAEFFNRRWLDYAGLSAEEASDWGWTVALHPDDRDRLVDYWRNLIGSGEAGEIEARLRRFDGEFRWFLFRAGPLRDGLGQVVKWYGTNTDLEARKRAEEALRSSEQGLRLIVDTIPGLVCTLNAAGEVERLNRQVLEYFGKTSEELKNWATSDAVHPDDLPRLIDAWRHSVETGQPYAHEFRQRRADGVYRWFQSRALPSRDAEGRITGWYMLLTDIDDRKQAEEELRRSEAYLTEAQRLSQTGSFGCGLLTGEMFWSEETFRIYGYDRSTQPAVERVLQRVHPEDRASVQERIDRAYRDGKDCQVECRLLLPDDSVKHVSIVARAAKNESGIIEFIGAVMDVTAQWQARAELEKALEEIKRLKDRLHDENVVLREQIDRDFMFEEIVGSSPALKTVLSSIVKVAPTDSTVLITGETGTGKELIARAIHKRSRRAGQAFISVNCASIPTSLIASELFGHEKGAFTGALQQRQGRFELAHAGTIFLDEIGELPAETQISLLRVLQERQFERVGGNRVVPTDVRVITASNRDLSAAIVAGTFRADLFYRLNVFPIRVPPLRKRKEDIAMLVEYFVKRYADKMGKQIRKIDKHTLELCQAYHWPGNIRELQNIIERSVILCSGDTFWVDAAWLSSQEPARLEFSGPLTETLQDQEKRLIEAALTESEGKVGGPEGAAAKLGLPRSTLDSKIKQLKIVKHKFTSSKS
jgi:PAS domain S-box-containing protein